MKVYVVNIVVNVSLKYSKQIKNLGVILNADRNFKSHDACITTRTGFYQLTEMIHFLHMDD